MATIRRVLPILATALLAAALGACGADKPAGGGSSELVVGVLLPMTGDTATYGEESWNGMQIALDEVKAKSPPFSINLVLNDEQSRQEQAGPQTKALIENHGARIVVGSVASSNTMQAAIVCKEAAIPLLTPASTNDTLTTETQKYGTNVFRVCFKDSFQGTILARFAANTLKAKRAAVLVDKGQAYSVGLADNFDREFKRLGGTTETEYYASTDKDFTALVQKVGATKPEVILLSGYYQQGGSMIRVSKEAWAGIPVIGGDGLDSPKLLALAGETNAKVYFTSHFVASDTDPQVQAFVSKYRARFKGEVPGAMAALGYDALYATYEAATKARAAHPEDPFRPEHLAEALRGLSFTGVTGAIRMDEDRTPDKSIVIVQAAGTFKFVEKIAP